MRALSAPLIAVVAILIAMDGFRSARAASGISQVTFVPWKVLKPGDEPIKGPLILYWIPASADDFRHSELLTSHGIVQCATQCIGLQVIRSDDVLMIEKLGVGAKVPVALLVDERGKVIAEAANDRGALTSAAVEKMLRDAIRGLEASLDRDLDDAPKKLSAGDRDSAVAIYRRVSSHRCLFPHYAREAERALRKLGVEVASER